MTCAKVARCKSKNLKGHPFGFYHNQAWESKPDHGTPVAESTRCQARPAGTTSNKADVEYEQCWKKQIGYSCGDGGANEAPLEMLEQNQQITLQPRRKGEWKEIKITQTKSQFIKILRGAHIRRIYNEAENKP